VFYATRINENAVYEVIQQKNNDILDYASGGVIKDEVIQLNLKDGKLLKARLVSYKDPLSNEVLQFLSNMFDYQAMTIVKLYKNRWNMEVLFKQLKQNFELSYFYSDKEEGIKSQIWIALIANLLFSVIHKQIKEAEQFITLVSMASNNLGSYTCFVSLLKKKKLSTNERNVRIVQMEMFQILKRGVFKNQINST
jgi:IS4 transposase